MKVYNVEVDATWNRIEKRIQITEYDVIKETPKTIVAQKEGYEKRFMKEDFRKITRSRFSANSRFSFYTTHEESINELINQGLEQGILLSEHNIHKLNNEINAMKEIQKK